MATQELHTKNSQEPPEPQETQQTSQIVTIFDVATEIETMLQDIATSVAENEQVVVSKVDKINKKLDKMEKSIRADRQ